jgi:hypothetical protein
MSLTNAQAVQIANLAVALDEADRELASMETAQLHGVHRGPREAARQRVSSLRVQLADAIVDATTTATGRAR